ncbi:hypothetical protein [Serinibacter salmoneus]|uniref:Uncharacterized protein n=1 Tax=Serinibacter salmoneus TaxID=556530 RepID=A0A2A9D213_9MICO|nr:hypothetical protein [Serinibacter salmoneus]PFG20758.1 hypothetical protein ATL40_2370 [Serinibacter salmoneus]
MHAIVGGDRLTACGGVPTDAIGSHDVGQVGAVQRIGGSAIEVVEVSLRQWSCVVALSALGGLLTAGCSAPEEDASDGSPGVGEVATPTATEAGAWDVSSWEPTVSIVAPSMTEDERLSEREEYLRSLAEQFELDAPPQVELVRWTMGPADDSQAMAACYTEAGFAAEVTPDNGIAFVNGGVPESQEAALNLANYTCAAQFTLDPIYRQEWSADQLGLLYDYWDQYFLPCMDAHGHMIDRSDQPSREVYVSSFHTSERTDWWPSDVLSSLPQEEAVQLGEDCPAYPPAEVFYGS